MNTEEIAAKAVPEPLDQQPSPDGGRFVTVDMLEDALGIAADETFALLRGNFQRIDKHLAEEIAYLKGLLEGLRRDLGCDAQLEGSRTGIAPRRNSAH